MSAIQKAGVPRVTPSELDLIRTKADVLAQSGRADVVPDPRWTPKSGHRSTPENRPPRVSDRDVDGGEELVAPSPP